MNPDEFMMSLKQLLDGRVLDERTLLVGFHPGLVRGSSRGYVTVTFINLPYARFKERRGGGAEAENNKLLFIVNGFNSDSSQQSSRVVVEHLVSNLLGVDHLRKKTASPEKISAYLADYINRAAMTVAPILSHD
jgi:hypothetical protein